MFVPRPQFFLSSQTSLSSLKIRGKSYSSFNNMDQIKHWQKCPGLFCKKGQMRDCKCGWDWVPSIVFFGLYDILILNCPWPGSDWSEWRVESVVYRTERRSPVKTLLTLLPTSHVRKSDSWRRIPCSHEKEYEETCLNQKNLLWKKWDKSGRINYRWLTMMLVYN